MDKETKIYLDGQFKVVNEHLGIVDQKVDVVDERLDRVDQRLDAVDKRLGTVDKRLDAVDKRLDTVDKRLNAVDQKFVETRRHFDVVAEDLTSKISLVAEGYDVLRRELQEFRGEVQVEFKELRSLVKFSYAELDRRISTLEEDFTSLKARLERLEKRTL